MCATFKNSSTFSVTHWIQKQGMLDKCNKLQQTAGLEEFEDVFVRTRVCHDNFGSDDLRLLRFLSLRRIVEITRTKVITMSWCKEHKTGFVKIAITLLYQRLLWNKKKGSKHRAFVYARSKETRFRLGDVYCSFRARTPRNGDKWGKVRKDFSNLERVPAWSFAREPTCRDYYHGAPTARAHPGECASPQARTSTLPGGQCRAVIRVLFTAVWWRYSVNEVCYNRRRSRMAMVSSNFSSNYGKVRCTEAHESTYNAYWVVFK